MGPPIVMRLLGVRPDRPASAVSGTFSESTPSLSTLCAMENFRGDPTGPALAVLPQPPPTGSAQGSAMVAGVQEDARKEPVRTYVGLERTAHVSIGASEGNTCGKGEKNAHFVSPKSEAFWGFTNRRDRPTIARSYPSRQLVGGQMGNLSKLLWFFFPTGVSTTPNPRVVRGAYRRRDPYPVASIPSIRDDNEAINRCVVNQFVNQFTCTCP